MSKMLIKNGVRFCHQVFSSIFRTITKIKQNLTSATNNIGRTRTRADIRNLQGGFGEILITVIPMRLDELIKCRTGCMNGIDCQMGVGDMSLLACDSQFGI